eukprot:6582050-Prymnesium_polylepis.2
MESSGIEQRVESSSAAEMVSKQESAAANLSSSHSVFPPDRAKGFSSPPPARIVTHGRSSLRSASRIRWDCSCPD